MMHVAVIGAGAAGCFCAAHLRRRMPDALIDVYEAGPKALAKVAVTGGGRCNLTNSFARVRSLSDVYPRGERLMKRALKAFSPEDTWRWFEDEGVPLLLQEDQCVFPLSQDAMQIVHTLLNAMEGVNLHLNAKVIRLEEGFRLILKDGKQFSADRVVITTGGAPKGLPMLAGWDLEMVPPGPSLCTLTVRDSALRSLMGLVADASVSLAGTRFRASGPLLITDWGISGPAILTLSSHAARYLAEAGYTARLSINWRNAPEDSVRKEIAAIAAANPRKFVASVHPDGMQSRLWEMLLNKAGFRREMRWGEMGNRGLNRLVSALTQDGYSLSGKFPFREEFVTCGGVSLTNINLSTLECKHYPGLYFVGEVLDVDAVTGGFNLQAAWSMGYVAAQSIAGS